MSNLEWLPWISIRNEGLSTWSSYIPESNKFNPCCAANYFDIACLAFLDIIVVYVMYVLRWTHTFLRIASCSCRWWIQTMNMQGVHTANTIVARSSAAVPPTPEPNIYIKVAESDASPVTDLVLECFVQEEDTVHTLVYQKSISECHKLPDDREASDFTPQIANRWIGLIKRFNDRRRLLIVNTGQKRHEWEGTV